jgi:DNA mismatch repair ATPase MutS
MFMPWDLFFVHQLAMFKGRLTSLLPVWLDTWYQLEALNSLGNFGYLNPDAVFPMFIGESDNADSPVFKSIDLGHPLIPDDKRVCNDFALNKLGEVVIITGSNMAGKSTFLRTLGVNLALAFSGSVVVATDFQTHPFRLFTCINVIDSLSDGISYFYAEVKRLKALLNELERHDTFPLFFLIDEIFRGTNNREREIGSRAFVNALTAKNGVGVISTHDLELVHLEDDISGILNYHFREDVKDGRMVFDYSLRRGPCPTTNALKIMRMEGLPVEIGQ